MRILIIFKQAICQNLLPQISGYDVSEFDAEFMFWPSRFGIRNPMKTTISAFQTSLEASKILQNSISLEFPFNIVDHHKNSNIEPLEIIAPISSLLQLFEASRTYLEPLAIIWSFLTLFLATCSYLKLLTPISNLLQSFEATCTYFELLSIIWSYLRLFWATCNYSKLPAPILSHLQLFWRC